MKVTYLFGAGASRQALPIVNEIPTRIRDILKVLRRNSMQLPDELFGELKIEGTKHQIQQLLIQDLEWLLSHSADHASVDTFAKKLYIKSQREDLKRLEIAFSVYLVLEQSQRPADKRYDIFFASILNNSIHSFPDNIRILSWNYDYQFEKSFSEFTEIAELDHNESALNIVTKFSSKRHSNDGFSIIKLNGGTTVFSSGGSRQHYFFKKFQNSIDLGLLEEVIRNYAQLKYQGKDMFSGLSFAWERPETTDERDIVKQASTSTHDTEVLVVIGYSFPYFNREIDRVIIGNMSKLSKVYFQSPEAEALRERFLSIRSDIPNERLVIRNDVEQFMFPNEL